MIYITSDWHINHKNIITFCNRPFPSVEAMEEDCLNYVNKIVGSDDIIWHLGDLHWSKDASIVKTFIEKIPCKMNFIRGNHDYGIDNLAEYLGLVNQISGKKPNPKIDIYDEYILHHKGLDITLNHYCKYTWYKRRYGQLHFFGHSHNPAGQHFGFGKSMEIGYDPQGKWLVPLDEAIAALRERDVSAQPTFDLINRV